MEPKERGNMLEKLQSIRERALERLNQAADTGALEQIRVAVLGKKVPARST